VTVLQIKATSPLTHNISGTAKAAVQSMLAFYLWGNKATVMGVLSIFVVLGGSLLYTFVKMDENKKQAGLASGKRTTGTDPSPQKHNSGSAKSSSSSSSAAAKDAGGEDLELAKPPLRHHSN